VEPSPTPRHTVNWPLALTAAVVMAWLYNGSDLSVGNSSLWPPFGSNEQQNGGNVRGWIRGIDTYPWLREKQAGVGPSLCCANFICDSASSRSVANSSLVPALTSAPFGPTMHATHQQEPGLGREPSSCGVRMRQCDCVEAGAAIKRLLLGIARGAVPPVHLHAK
jgi:hypothetical protein